MSHVEVFYHDARVGTLAETRDGILFEYDATFLTSGHDLSPLNLPLRPGLHRRTSRPRGLPGLFEDSLPGAWGNRLMMDWFARQGIDRHSVTPLMKLSYIGNHGMGALTYEPAMDSIVEAHPISLHDLHEAASKVAQSRATNLDALAEVGSSAGGAHPKALIGLPLDSSDEILAGASDLPATHEAWLVKFDMGREASGALELAYALMTRAAKIEMPPVKILETRHGKTIRRHFAVKRFDREGVARIHHHTLAGLSHTLGSDLDYETLLRVTRRVTRDEQDVLQAYRRAVFNVLASNRDDHGVNHGFLYRDRKWRLSPAYDVTFRGPGELAERGMSLCGERRNAGRSHLLALAESEALDRQSALAIVDDVSATLSRWREFADEAGVPAKIASEVGMILPNLS